MTLASRLGPEEAYEIRIARVDPEDNIVYQSIPLDEFLGYILISGITSDGNLLLIGQTMNGDNTDIQALAIDYGGNIISRNSFGSPMNDMLLDIIDVGNNEFLAVGWSSSSGFVEERFIYLVKLDSNGDVIWEKRIGSGDLSGYNISPTKDGNYIIGGSMPNIASGMYAASLIKVDPSGNMIWKKPVSPGPYTSLCTGAIETSDGGFAISGYFDNNGPNAYYRYIAKTDSHGNCTDSITIIEE